MNNGDQIIAVKPSVMNWRKLKARKAYLGLTVAQIAEKAGVCEKTVSLFLNGDDAVRPEIQDAITRVLQMRRVIDFELIEADRGFSDAVGAM
jgi:hypothetical protein